MLSHGIPVVIGLLTITSSMFSFQYYADAQTIPIPEFKPKAPEVQNDGSSQIQPDAEPEPPRPMDYAMKKNLNLMKVSFLRMRTTIKFQTSLLQLATLVSCVLLETVSLI